jgi:hypothetical protein
VVCVLLLVLWLLSRGSPAPVNGCRSLLLVLFAVLLVFAFSDSTAPLILLGCWTVAALVWAFTAEDEVAGWLSTMGLLIAEQWMRRPIFDDLHA